MQMRRTSVDAYVGSIEGRSRAHAQLTTAIAERSEPKRLRLSGCVTNPRWQNIPQFPFVHDPLSLETMLAGDTSSC